MISENIEGPGNLYKISEFINRDQIRTDINIDIEKCATMKTLTTPSIFENNTEQIYSDIMSSIQKFKANNLSAKSDAPMTFSEKKPEPKSESFKDLMPTDSQIDENLLLKTFDYTPKKPAVASNVSSATNYEKQQFNNILYGGVQDNTDDSDTERLSLLESINDVRRELSAMEDINIDSIPQVDENSSVYDLRKIYKLLLYKKNTTLHFETARDFMMIGINQVVRFCNGQNGRPNLVGWERTAQSKLSILKTEVTKLASDVFKQYDIGSIGQILISLVPSAIMFAITKDKHQNVMKSDNNDALQKLRGLI